MTVIVGTGKPVEEPKKAPVKQQVKKSPAKEK